MTVANSVNIDNKIVEGVFAFAKLFTPVLKYEKQDEYELTIDVIVSEAEAKKWNKAFSKQKARVVDTAEFKDIFKIDPPFPDQDEQFIIKVKRSTTYKDGNEVPKDYWPKVYQQVGSKRINLGEKLIAKNANIANGSTGKVSFEVITNKFGCFASCKNILVTSLIEFQLKSNDGSEFGDNLDETEGDFDEPIMIPNKTPKSKQVDPDEPDSPF